MILVVAPRRREDCQQSSDRHFTVKLQPQKLAVHLPKAELQLHVHVHARMDPTRHAMDPPHLEGGKLRQFGADILLR